MAISPLGSQAYDFLMFLLVIVALAFMFLFWLGVAKLASSKEEWKKEKSQNIEMAMVGAAFVVVMSLLAALSE